MEIGGFPSEGVSEALRVGRFECQSERIKRRVFLRDRGGMTFKDIRRQIYLKLPTRGTVDKK